VTGCCSCSNKVSDKFSHGLNDKGQYCLREVRSTANERIFQAFSFTAKKILEVVGGISIKKMAHRLFAHQISLHSNGRELRE
jgi:hypothetical protein